MTTHDGDHFQCNECGRKMRWNPAIAGRTGRCKCGAVVRVPEAVDPPAEVDLLDALAQPTAPVVEASIAYNAPPTPLQYQPVRAKAAAGAIPSELVREYSEPRASRPSRNSRSRAPIPPLRRRRQRWGDTSRLT